MTDDGTRYALLVESQASGEYLTLTARVMHLSDDGTPRNITADDAYSVDPMAGIAATAQADRDPGRTYAYGQRLGIRLGFDTMPTANVAATLATLRRLESRLDRLSERIGPAASFGGWCARIADALGMPILTGQTGRNGMYSDGAYVSWRPGDAVGIIDGWIATHRNAS